MNIIHLSDTAKSVLNKNDYNILMENINNRSMSSARIFIEDKIDEIIFSSKLESVAYRYDQVMRLREIDVIITNEIINKINVNGAKRISE